MRRIKGGKNKLIYKRKNSARDNGLSCSSALHDYEAKLRKAVNYLKERAISEENFENDSMYEIALYEADCKYRKENEPTSTLGGSLKSDQKLIASGIAMSSNRPVVLISQDSRLLSSFIDITKTIIGNESEVKTYSIKTYMREKGSEKFYDESKAWTLHLGEPNASKKRPRIVMYHDLQS